jgi:hypothetical protein
MKSLEDMQSFEPSSLAEYFIKKYPNEEWIPDAFNSANIVKWESAAYCYLLESNEFKVNYSIYVEHPEYWMIVVDVVTLNGIKTLAGIEFVGNIKY